MVVNVVSCTKPVRKTGKSVFILLYYKRANIKKDRYIKKYITLVFASFFYCVVAF